MAQVGARVGVRRGAESNALQKRSARKDTFPSHWDISAAGHVAFDPETQGEERVGRERKEQKKKNECSDDDGVCLANEADDDGDHFNSSRNTAARELAEELGVHLRNPKTDLTFAFTCAAAQANVGGCNCYEDVYFLLSDSSKGAAQFSNIGKAEVDSVDWFDWPVVVASWQRLCANKTFNEEEKPKRGSSSSHDKEEEEEEEEEAQHQNVVLVAPLVPRAATYVQSLDKTFSHLVASTRSARAER